jgi:hypothetical protein
MQQQQAADKRSIARNEVTERIPRQATNHPIQENPAWSHLQRRLSAAKEYSRWRIGGFKTQQSAQ